MSAINPKMPSKEQDEVEVYKKEMAESKPKYECYELLKKLVDDDKRLKSSEVDELENYLRTIRLAPVNKFPQLVSEKPIDLTQEVSFLADWNKFVMTRVAQGVDDKICGILAEVIFKDAYHQGDKGKVISKSIRLKALNALLLNATWNIDKESEEAIVVFIKIGLDQLEEEFHEPLVEALQQVITCAIAANMLADVLHAQYFERGKNTLPSGSRIGSFDVRLKAIQVLSHSTNAIEKIVDLYMNILEVSDIIKNEYYGRSRIKEELSVKELMFHHDQEDTIIKALIAGLNLIVAKQILLGEMDKKVKERLENSSDSVKYKFTIHNPLLSKPDAPRLVTPKIIPAQVQSTTKNRVKTKKPLPAPLQPALPTQPAPIILSQPNPLLGQTAPLQLPTGQTTTPETQALNTAATPSAQPTQNTRPYRLPLPTPKKQ